MIFFPDGSDTLVYRSDYLQDEPNPAWPAVTITSDKLCNGDWNRQLKVSKNNTYIAMVFFREINFTKIFVKMISRKNDNLFHHLDSTDHFLEVQPTEEFC